MRRSAPFAMICLALCLGALCATRSIAGADPDPRRKLIVLEYRAGSSALPGVAARVVAILAQKTSLAVLGQDQSRAIYGDQLDQVLVRCAGDAACVARIGQKIGAAEVVLVGVSELGDVILTMQRIDVAAREIVGRIADSLATGAVPSSAQITEYVTRLLPPSDFLRFGVIDIVANLAGAAVTVGGRPRGTTPIAALTLPAPASYEIRLDKPGYVPFTTRVALPPDGEVRVEAELARRGGEPAWYQRWYVVAAVGVVVAGAAGTALYVATRRASDDGALHVTGSIH